MFLTVAKCLNANRCVVTKTKRATFARQYPTRAVLPDGSTITGKIALLYKNVIYNLYISVKYPEPRHLIRFPINLDEATEEQKKRIQLLRRPKQKLIVEEDKGAKFDPRKYVKF